jgi:hypothetical protein
MSGRINFMSMYHTKQRVRAGEKLTLTSINNVNRKNNIARAVPNVDNKNKPIVYKYKVFQNGPDSSLNIVLMNFEGTQAFAFAAMGATPLYDTNWGITGAFITITGHRLLASTDPGIIPPIPSIYTETLDIHTDSSNALNSSFLTAKMNYVDNSEEGKITQLSILNYVITGGNGIFKNKTNLLLKLDNVNYTREIIIT